MSSLFIEDCAIGHNCVVNIVYDYINEYVNYYNLCCNVDVIRHTCVVT